MPTGTALGSYPFTLTATDGVLDYSLSLTLNVGDFTISVSPSVQQALPTDTATYMLTLGSIDYYNQEVNLTCSGLPAGASCPSPFGNGAGGPAFPVAITTQSVATGNYQFTITGVSNPLTHNAVATLQIWDFASSVTPLRATVNAGGSANFTVTVASVNGFDGNVTLWCQNPGAVTCSFSTSSGSVPANGNLTSTLTVTASSGAGSAAQDRAHSLVLGTLFLLPFGGLVFFVVTHRPKSTSIVLLLLVLGLSVACGGGSSGGGGGGGGGTQYSIGVQVTSGSSTKTAGTITLTVN